MRKLMVSAGAASCALLSAAVATATPSIDSAVLHTRVFNDFPNSTLTTTNLYPALIEFSDGPVGPGPFANRHNFRLSDNSGISDAVFLNGDAFTFEADVTIFGDGPTEGGLQVSPWWSQNVDGIFNMRIPDGEVAVFGGRLPFYNFTANHGVTYVAGTTVHQKFEYNPNGLSAGSPGTMTYTYTDGSGTYSSGPLNFDEGNPAEDPPYGLWGILNDARVGGGVQIMNFDAGTHSGGARFENMVFTPEPTSLALLGLALLPALRRRG
jgi:hypothetical protein